MQSLELVMKKWKKWKLQKEGTAYFWKNVNIYDKKWKPKWKNDKITKSLISRVRLAEIIIRKACVCDI